jgi:glucuronate isomerase
VNPRLFSDPAARFGTPVDLFIIPDHYVFRMLYSQGIPLEALGIPRYDGSAVETDHLKIWKIFADHYSLFHGTPSGLWLTLAMESVFSIRGPITSKNAAQVYHQIQDQLNSPAFTPRALYDRFNIEVLCTTDPATDPLAHHQKIRASGWKGDIRPTFRPDAVVQVTSARWVENLKLLSAASGIEVHDFPTFIQALEHQRRYFQSMGATATDHAVEEPLTVDLSPNEVHAIFQRALDRSADAADARAFNAHMLVEMARMSAEDGLVMQIHPGSLRNHNPLIAGHFGPDMGADIPIQTEFTRNLRVLLEKFGNHPNFSILLFTLDETTYSRELAPLAGHYPAVKLGPPWWFHDSPNGMRRYFDQVYETAGIFNTAGFNDDTRAFLSIPARHDVWRRVCSGWLAEKVLSGLLEEETAFGLAVELANNLARKAYKLNRRK